MSLRADEICSRSGQRQKDAWDSKGVGGGPTCTHILHGKAAMRAMKDRYDLT